ATSLMLTTRASWRSMKTITCGETSTSCVITTGIHKSGRGAPEQVGAEHLGERAALDAVLEPERRRELLRLLRADPLEGAAEPFDERFGQQDVADQAGDVLAPPPRIGGEVGE